MKNLQFIILCPDELKELLIVKLDELLFEGFWDNGDSIYAYIPENAFNHKLFYDTLSDYGLENNYTYGILDDKNWNEEWEKNFDPIAIDNQVYIRAAFHPSSELPFEIIINPKMSFGTGHHATTRLCTRLLLPLNIHNKRVLDMGTGTGILAILAEKKGARFVQAIDNDQWSFENCLDNIKENNCKNVEVVLGSVEEIINEPFDVVISNITKNINMTLLPHLADKVLKGGWVILAGFLDFDTAEILESAEKKGLKLKRQINEEAWQALLLEKI